MIEGRGMAVGEEALRESCPAAPESVRDLRMRAATEVFVAAIHDGDDFLAASRRADEAARRRVDELGGTANVMGKVLSGELTLSDDAPFGYDRVGDKLVPNGDADLVRKVFEAYLLYAERPLPPAQTQADEDA